MTTSLKILLCDDSELVRSLVVQALKGAGFDVTTVDDPSRLGDAMAREEPDLVLVDATFRGTDEARLVELVKPHAAARAVLMFSDRPEAEVEALVDKIGAAGTVPKGDVSRLPARLKDFFSSRVTAH